MKAKKIIAIGLVVAMTLGMSTSVFASEPQPNPYNGYPVFDGWEETYEPGDNVFHAKGQGWLESGVGINESVTNVIVPTTPNLDLGYGHPGLYDFGFDPQRLVDRTNALKYKDKESFTPDAKNSGVYFINDGELFGSDLNTYDNKSVKLKGTNIGTEPVGFAVTANLVGGKNFTILTADPVPAVEPEPEIVLASDFFATNFVDGNDSYYAKWLASAANPYQEGERNEIRFAKDLTTGGGYPGYFSDIFNADELNDIQALKETPFVPVAGGDTSYLRQLLSAATEGQEPAVSYYAGLLTYLQDYKEVLLNNDPQPDPQSTDPQDKYGKLTNKVGMYLSLNVSNGDENYEDKMYEKNVEPNVFKEVNKTEGTKIIKAEASKNVRVDGTAGNYKTIWDEGKQDYVRTIISKDDDDYQPFKTVAFWFKGAATYSEAVSKDVEIPALEFTWTFSKDAPEPPVPPVPPVVEEPKLATVDGEPYEGEPVFTVAQYGETGVTLGYDLGSYSEISDVLLLRSTGEYVSLGEYLNSYCTISYEDTDEDSNIDLAKLVVKRKVFDDVLSLGKDRVWKVRFITTDDKTKDLIVTFTEGI